MGKLSVKIILLMLVTLWGWAGSAGAVDLTVNIQGSGSGSVGSSPAPTGGSSMPCSSGTCTPPYDVNTSVTLTATPADSGSIFIGWSGDCSGTGTCQVTMDTAKNVTATFAASITVTTNGTGSGSVISSPPGINCDNTNNDCSETFLDGTTVTLTATQNSQSVFSGWSGDAPAACQTIPILAICNVTSTTQAQNIIATFTSVVPNAVNLTVINEGSGSDYGQVKSSPVGITCEGDKYDGSPNTDCTQAFVQGTGVDLFAKVNADPEGAFFSGWIVEFLPSGATAYVQQTNMCLGLEPTCHVTVPFNVSDIRVRAKYDLGFILTIRRDGSGAGTITTNSDNQQAICSTTLCTQTYNKGRVVTLTATANNSSKFKEWRGACTGADPNVCNVTMDRARAVTAVFDPVNPSRFDLTLIKEGSGSDYGSVVSVESSTDPVKCGGSKADITDLDCTGNFAAGEGITLKATGNGGAVFSRWQVYYLNNDDPPKFILQPNMCTGLEPLCHITMASHAQVRAQFDLGYILTVVRDGTGQGSIVSDSPDLDQCTTTNKNICNQTFNKDRLVTLNAVAASNSKFVAWNACTSNGLSTTDPLYEGTLGTNKEVCKVKMDKAKLVTATFNSIASIAVSTKGAGLGRVTSAPAAIDCRSASDTSICAANFNVGAGVTLTATADSNSKFVKWGGVCDSRGASPTCLVTVGSDPQAVDAIFELTIDNTALLNVNKGGTGKGTVKSVPDGIDCNNTDKADCFEKFSLGSDVTLLAVADTGSKLTQWSGDAPANCKVTPVPLTCTVTIDQARSIFATFDSSSNQLKILFTGGGKGRVVSISGIDCDNSTNDCTKSFSESTSVELNAIASEGSSFDGWKGASGCSIDPICIVTMNEARLVQAAFKLQSVVGLKNAIVVKKGSGSSHGIVTSTPSGINCGIDVSSICSFDFDSTKRISFKADIDNSNLGVIFSGWEVSYVKRTEIQSLTPSGTFTIEIKEEWTQEPNVCTGTEVICDVSLTADVRVVAKFDFNLVLTAVRNGNGTGKILTTNSDLNKCTVESDKNICTGSFIGDEFVTLTAIANNDSKFVKWTACTGNNLATTDPAYEGVSGANNEVCRVKMNQAKLVTATFEKGQQNTNVLAVTLSGSGKVVSNPDGITCGSDCLKSYQENTTVTLQATPDKDNVFNGWGGACSGSSPVCTVTMTELRLVTANFGSILSMTVSKSGTGLGNVTSDISGINCGSNCSFDFSKGTGIRLTAKPEANSRFKGWSGACASAVAEPICSLTITGAAQVAGAEFEIISGPMLTVTKDGTGIGNVSSRPTAIDCGPVCAENFSTNALVTLSALPDSVSSFAGWGGACSNRATLLTCQVVMDQVKNVSATFNIKTNTLTVAKEGLGVGEIVSNPAGINCGANCTANFVATVKVALSATASPGSVFIGWSGVCQGQGATCYVTMDQTRTATAKFSLANQLSVTNLGTGFGTVISNPVGISCDGTCSASFLKDTAITLTANAIGGSEFTGWGGVCSGTKATCFLTMKSGQTVTATFNWLGNNVNTGLIFGKLNDTGIDWCANNSAAYLANKEGMCGSLMTTHPLQDGQEGRDMYARQGLLTKLGKGEAGFDYTKICNNGQAAGEGVCPLAPTLGDADTNWGCTRDNVTNLIWEVKTVGGLRDKDALFTWYESNDRINGGDKGDNCTGENCNTDRYMQAVNQQGLCGANDWYLPTRHELHSIANQGRGKPSIDITYFPNTAVGGYWTATPVAAQVFNAWYVNFEYGWDYWDNKSNQQRVRLVRVCQTCEDNTPASSPVFSKGRLLLPAVNVDGQFYSANLMVAKSNPLTFKLIDAQPVTKRLGRSGNSDQVRYYPSDRRAVIGGVVVDASRYNATLQMVPGSNPPLFELSAARLAR